MPARPTVAAAAPSAMRPLRPWIVVGAAASAAFKPCFAVMAAVPRNPAPTASSPQRQGYVLDPDGVVALHLDLPVCSNRLITRSPRSSAVGDRCDLAGRGAYAGGRGARQGHRAGALGALAPPRPYGLGRVGAVFDHRFDLVRPQEGGESLGEYGAGRIIAISRLPTDPDYPGRARSRPPR